MWSCGESQRTCKQSWASCPAGPQSSWYGTEAPPSPKGQKRPLAPTGPKGFPAACRLIPGHWQKQGVWLRPLVLLLVAGCCWLLLLCLLLRPVAHTGHRGWSQAACNPAGRAPAITDIKVIHSYWSPERKHFAPSLCESFSKQSNYLSQVPCMAFPGYHATNATQEQVGWQSSTPATRIKPSTQPAPSRTVTCRHVCIPWNGVRPRYLSPA